MPRRAREISRAGYYHIVQRGIGKQILFEEDKDYQRFLQTLKKVLQDEESFEVLAYCLMENHIHLLIHADEGLDRIMKRINSSYAYYFNEKYSRVGHLFQDRFRSEPINDERKLLAVVKYIHDNPQKAGICRRDEYPWSSWHTYLGEEGFASVDLILELMGGVSGFLFSSTNGDEAKCLDVVDKRRITDKEALQLIRKELPIESGTQLQSMCRKDRDEALRKMKESGLSVRQIERLTGVNRGAVHRA